MNWDEQANRRQNSHTLISNKCQPIRIMLAEDHQIVRRAFAELLGKEPDMEIVGEVGDATALIETVGLLLPDVLLLDAHMPGGKVITAARTLHKEYSDVQILVLSAYEHSEYIIGLIRAGVTGYVLKHDSTKMLIEAVRAVARGEEWISPRVAEILVRSMRNYEDRSTQLTERELEVLSLIGKGYTNEQIAEALVVTHQTVKNHVSKIFHKLGVETRVDAVLYALRFELDSVPNDDKHRHSH